MSSVYTGLGSNVSQSTSPTETIPSDGDALAVVSVNPALQKVLDHIALIWAGSFTGQTSATPGLQGTGGASAQGGKFTAGGTSSPVKGMVNLVPTTNAPSSPDNGDLWLTTAGVVGVRANSVTEELAKRSFTDPRLAKAWAYLTLGSAGAVTVTAGLGVSSASYTGSNLTVNFSPALASANYAVLISLAGVTGCSSTSTEPHSTTFAVLQLFTTSTGAALNWPVLGTVSVAFYI